jgi:hypothetical protein
MILIVPRNEKQTVTLEKNERRKKLKRETKDQNRPFGIFSTY